MKLGDNQHHRGCPDLDTLPPPTSAAEAAESLKVGKSNVYKAKQAQNNGVPAVVEAVETGTVTLNAAEVVYFPAGAVGRPTSHGPAG
jgi:hypothetical protein